MKILLLGDHSNYHATLAIGLSRRGHEVTVASDGSGWMDTARTIDLSRKLPGPAGGALLYARLLTTRQLQGYDIVSIISPTFVTLRPHRLSRLFTRLRRYNGAVFLSAVGTDKATIDFLTSADCPLRYNEYVNPDKSPNEANAATLQHDLLWTQGDLADLCDTIYDNTNGVTTATYEYHLAMQRRIPESRLAYAGIPIDTQAVTPLDRPLIHDGRINMFLGRHSTRQSFKGTDRIGTAAARVAAELPDRCRLTIVEDVPYSQYIKELRQADIVLDQLYSYSPATNALLAMATGQAVLSGAEPEYYHFIGETSLFPIINALPDDNQLYQTLKDTVLNPETIIAAGQIGRKFVSRHNDTDIVASRCLDFWTTHMDRP